jgi:hypothetical protein
MKALQMLKYMLKKECLNFIKGWSTSEATMGGESKATGDLGSLIIDDPDTVSDCLNTLLKSLSNYN